MCMYFALLPPATLLLPESENFYVNIDITTDTHTHTRICMYTSMFWVYIFTQVNVSSFVLTGSRLSL